MGLVEGTPPKGLTTGANVLICRCPRALPAFGLVLRPEIAALSMSGSSFLVAVNALLLKRLRLPERLAQPEPTPAQELQPAG